MAFHIFIKDVERRKTKKDRLVLAFGYSAVLTILIMGSTVGIGIASALVLVPLIISLVL